MADLEFLRTVFVRIGAKTPLQRAVISTVAVTVPIVLFKPVGIYTHDGKALPFTPLANEGEPSTYVPWWLPGATFGLVSSVFI